MLVLDSAFCCNQCSCFLLQYYLVTCFFDFLSRHPEKSWTVSSSLLRTSAHMLQYYSIFCEIISCPPLERIWKQFSYQLTPSLEQLLKHATTWWNSRKKFSHHKLRSSILWLCPIWCGWIEPILEFDTQKRDKTLIVRMWYSENKYKNYILWIGALYYEEIKLESVFDT